MTALVGDIRQARTRVSAAFAATVTSPGVRSVPHRRTERDGVLHGRGAECAALDRLIDGARYGHGAALVLRGDGGTGKSALLRYAEARGTDMTVLRVDGVDAEIDLPFAGVHQLLRPVLGRIDTLPEPQSRALRSAMGLDSGPPDRFMAAAGVLSLLAGMAAHRPLLLVMDDAHRLDRESRETLLFTARRLGVEPISVLLAVRDRDDLPEAAGGLPELRITSLDADAAAALFDDHLPAEVAPHVRLRLLELADGNPLALLELPRALSATQLQGRATLPDPVPISHDLARALLHGVDALSDAARRLLLVAAAERAGDVDLVVRAAAGLGCGAGALTDAEAAGLLVVDGGRFRFCQPWARSAAYGAASRAQRRAAHAALALALDAHADGDRRAWHRAAAVVGRDREVAAALEHTAQRALERSGYAKVATALERASDLTSEPEHLARRLVAAADAAFNAGQLERAGTLLDRASPVASDAVATADIQFLRGQCELAAGAADRGFDILIAGAERIAPTKPQRAAAMATVAGIAACWRNDAAQLARVAEHISVLGDDTGCDDLTVRLAHAFTSIFRGDVATGASLATAAASAAERVGGPYALSMAGTAALLVGDDVDSLRLLTQAAAAARSQGAAAILIDMLAGCAVVEAWTGHVTSAATHAAEGLALAEQTGHDRQRSLCLAVLAWMHAMSGDGEECDRLAVQAGSIGLEQEFTPATALAAWARGLRILGAGRPEEAHSQLVALSRADNRTSHPMVAAAATGDIVEAAVMADDPGAALTALGALERFAAGRQPWALAIAARCRGLTSAPGDAERHFVAALAHHAHGSRPFEHGRTLLSYGSWLRRQRRRVDARQQLRAALRTFEHVGAADWQARTRRELRASGETGRAARPSGAEALTAQELHIVQIVRQGATNKQVAAQLYLSPRTIDYHLRKVFVKLGLSSRAELIARAPDDPALATAP